MDKLIIENLIEILRKEYGDIKFKPREDPIKVLIQTILSQNTSDHNSVKSFENLMSQYTDFDALAIADTSDIAAVIRSGGLAEIKAQRIKDALVVIKQDRGKIDLTFLNNLPLTEAREWLKKLPGVGNKTANCVLLFASGRPALPVDTHIFRISGRLKLINPEISLDEAHRILGLLVPAKHVLRFHILMIEHGRRTCVAQNPRCYKCALIDICPEKLNVILNKAN